MKVWEWALLFALVLLARLAHSEILWVEEAYPMAAAVQMWHGLLPYRDFFFDKPPLTALFYLTPLPLRVLGAAFVTLCAWLLSRLSTEPRMAAWLTAFFFTFGTPATVMAISPDVLMFAPHVAAVWMALRGRAVASGICCGLALLTHAKGLFVIAAALLFLHSPWIPVIGLAMGALPLAIPGYWEQVWEFGRLYSGDTFVQEPAAEGLRRTAAWLGFHAALAIPAIWILWKERNWRWAAWAAISLASVALGLRFFPRYYFQLLPVAILLGARGLALMPSRWRLAALALLLIPAVRFGPRYATLALQGDGDWADTAMNRDSRLVERYFSPISLYDETVFVWGYRPDITVYTGLKLGAPFLDSQPLTGVLADRHLTSMHVSAPELARRNRERLPRTRPTFVIDGLGPYNPRLAIAEYPDLAAWLAQYEVVHRTPGSVVYRLAPRPAR